MRMRRSIVKRTLKPWLMSLVHKMNIGMIRSATKIVPIMVRTPTRRHSQAIKSVVGIEEPDPIPASCLISPEVFLLRSTNFWLRIKRRSAYEAVVTMIERTKKADIDIRDAVNSLTCILKTLAENVDWDEEEGEFGKLCHAFSFCDATFAFDNRHICHERFMGTSGVLTDGIDLGNAVFQ